MRRGNATTSRTRGLGQVTDVGADSGHCEGGPSITVRNVETDPQLQWMAQRLIDDKGRCDGSSMAMDGTSALLWQWMA